MCLFAGRVSTQDRGGKVVSPQQTARFKQEHTNKRQLRWGGGDTEQKNAWKAGPVAASPPFGHILRLLTGKQSSDAACSQVTETEGSICPNLSHRSPNGETFSRDSSSPGTRHGLCLETLLREGKVREGRQGSGRGRSGASFCPPSHSPQQQLEPHALPFARCSGHPLTHLLERQQTNQPLWPGQSNPK